MARAKETNDSTGVNKLIQQLEPNFAKLVKSVRAVILSADKEIGEQVKWNAPAFFYPGAMKAFDAKEYKRDIVVMHLRKGIVLLVFPTGATIPDTSGILEGDYTDGRRMITISNATELAAKKSKLQKVIRQWLQLVEKE